MSGQRREGRCAPGRCCSRQGSLLEGFWVTCSVPRSIIHSRPVVSGCRQHELPCTSGSHTGAVGHCAGCDPWAQARDGAHTGQLVFTAVLSEDFTLEVEERSWLPAQGQFSDPRPDTEALP